jgi:hypothetical protein
MNPSESFSLLKICAFLNVSPPIYLCVRLKDRKGSMSEKRPERVVAVEKQPQQVLVDFKEPQRVLAF